MMSDLRSLIQDSKKSREELIASTVRLPRELHLFIDDLAEHLALSRQEILLSLIKEGASVAKEELKWNVPDEEGESGGFHVLNTNKRHTDEDHRWMMADGIAAAFYDPWKFNIDRIKKGDIVFLYENSVGIVAYGEGSGLTLKKDRAGDKDECHYQELKNFKRLPVPMPAIEVKKLLGRNVVFLRTMSGMPDGKKVLDRLRTASKGV
jgi:hypothetical protein